MNTSWTLLCVVLLLAGRSVVNLFTADIHNTRTHTKKNNTKNSQNNIRAVQAKCDISLNSDEMQAWTWLIGMLFINHKD